MFKLVFGLILVVNLENPLHADTAASSAEKCQQLLNEREENGAYKFWENLKTLKPSAEKKVYEFYLKTFLEPEESDNIEDKCTSAIEALENLNRKSWTKAIMGSSSGACLSVLKQACDLSIKIAYNLQHHGILPLPDSLKKGGVFGTLTIEDSLPGNARSQVFAATLNKKPVVIKLMSKNELNRTQAAAKMLKYSPALLIKSSGKSSWVVLEKLVPFEYTDNAARALFDQLATLHRNEFTHSDISPGNVMGRGNGSRLIDFEMTEYGTPPFSLNKFRGEDPKKSDLVALGRVLLNYRAVKNGEMSRVLEELYESIIKKQGFREHADRDAVTIADSGKGKFIEKYSSVGSLYRDDIFKDREIYRYYVKNNIVTEGQHWNPSSINTQHYNEAERELKIDQAKMIFDALFKASGEDEFAKFLHKVAMGEFPSAEAAIKAMPSN